MPGIATVVENKFLYQRLVYWAKIGSDGFGKPTYADAVELRCRWEDKPQEIISPEKRLIVSRNYILLTANLALGSLVLLSPTVPAPVGSALAYWQTLPNYPLPPTVNLGGREILLVKTTPEIKALASIYEAFC